MYSNTDPNVTIIRATETDRLAIIRETRGSHPFEVFFGQDIDGEFRASYSKPSREYKSPKTAERAAKKWAA